MDFVGVELSIGIEIENDPRGDRLNGFRIDVADSRNDGAGLVRYFDGISAGGQERLYRGVRCSDGKLLVKHFLDGFELRVGGFARLRFAATDDKCGDGKEQEK